MENHFKIGIITGAHGLKGDIKVYPTTDDINRFEYLKTVCIIIKGKCVTYEIENVWYHKNFVMLKLTGINDMTEALALKEAEIIVDYKDAIPLEEDEYFVKDLIGLHVFTVVGEYLGEISERIETGANDVYVIKKDGAKDLLIPAIKDCVLSVDINNKKMIVKLLDGLRDEI